MSEKIGYYFQVASTFSVLLPIFFGILRWKNFDSLIHWFIFFLGVGFANDMAGWIFYLTKNIEGNAYARHSYDLFEATFLFWFLCRASADNLSRKLLPWFLAVLLAFWAARLFFPWGMTIFKTTTEIAIAFVTAFLILQKVEANAQIWRLTIFWLLVGMFFYCFSTYFLMGLLGAHLQQIWYSHAVINILTNIIYFIGFFKFLDQSHHERASSLP